MVQLSHPYMITRKAIALTRRTFAGKVMSLLFNMLSRLVKAFLHINSEWMNDLDRRMRGTDIRIIHFSAEESPSFLHWEVSVGMVTSLMRTPVIGLGAGITHDSSEIDCICKNHPLKQGHVCLVFR